MISIPFFIILIIQICFSLISLAFFFFVAFTVTFGLVFCFFYSGVESPTFWRQNHFMRYLRYPWVLTYCWWDVEIAIAWKFQIDFTWIFLFEIDLIWSYTFLIVIIQHWTRKWLSITYKHIFAYLCWKSMIWVVLWQFLSTLWICLAL